MPPFKKGTDLKIAVQIGAIYPSKKAGLKDWAVVIPVLITELKPKRRKK